VTEGAVMRMKKESDISQIQELEYIGAATCPGGLTRRLMARIARRPGRWRARMHTRHNTFDDELFFYDEAA